MRHTYRPSDDFTIDLAPLIDVVFLLVIFLLVSSNLSKKEHISIDLPKASADPKPLNEEIQINVSDNGTISVDGYLLGDAMSIVNRLVSYEKDSVVNIRADKATDYQTIISVLDALGRANFINIKLQTQSEK